MSLTNWRFRTGLYNWSLRTSPNDQLEQIIRGKNLLLLLFFPCLFYRRPVRLSFAATRDQISPSMKAARCRSAGEFLWTLAAFSQGEFKKQNNLNFPAPV